MKLGKTFGVSLAAVAIALVGASTARADDHKSTVNVPFNFTAGHTQLPAGRYAITSVGDNSLVAITSLESGKSVLLLTSPRTANDPAPPPQLMFEKIDNQYVLSQITLESSSGHRIIVAPARIRAARQAVRTAAVH